MNTNVLTAIDQITWTDGFPLPPIGWEIILIDPGRDRDFSDLNVGAPVYADGTETLLGYAWGDTQSLMRKERKAMRYVIMNDGQFRWPALRSDYIAALKAGRDPFAVGECPIPTHLMDQIGWGVGSDECVALCDHLVAQGAEIMRPEPR